MNIFARLVLSGNSGASKVLCAWSAAEMPLKFVETAGGRVVSLQTDGCLMGGSWELGDLICMYVENIRIDVYVIICVYIWLYGGLLGAYHRFLPDIYSGLSRQHRNMMS